MTPEVAEVANKYLHKSDHENKTAAPKLKCLCFLKQLVKPADEPIAVTAVAKTCPLVKYGSSPFNENNYLHKFQQITTQVEKHD